MRSQSSDDHGGDRIFSSVGRGVWRIPAQLSNGRWMLVAVARSGRIVAEAEYSDADSYEIAMAEVERALDEADPPMLRVI